MDQQNLSQRDLVDVDALIRRGELTSAYDMALSRLGAAPYCSQLRHRAVLCLANAGALDAAMTMFHKLGLQDVTDDEDILCLKGKILKSRGLDKADATRSRILGQAADQYYKAYELRSGHYPGINHATLLLLAGDRPGSRKAAHSVLDSLGPDNGKTGERAYYRLASMAEAQLLLGEQQEAEATLAQAITLDPANYRARATTIRQISLILDHAGADKTWLDPMRPPRTAHFAGYLFSAGRGHRAMEESVVHQLEADVSHMIRRKNIGFGYGALAAGADIVMAEALLSQAAELHIVLPIKAPDFIRKSVAPYGDEWVGRFDACIKRATSVRIASRNLFDLDEALLQFSSQVAMGQTIMKAEALASQAIQLLVWDGPGGDVTSLTSSDYQLWKATGLEQETFKPDVKAPPRSCEEKEDYGTRRKTLKRVVMALLFADFHKFGELDELQVSVFLQDVLTPIAAAIKETGCDPVEVNTWGDGLFFAFEKIDDAAKCALKLQSTFEAMDLEALGLPEGLSLRVGANFGPVFSGIDPFLNRPTVFGPNVLYAARIEPVTVPGSIYVSEGFASVLATKPGNCYRCEYIGEVRLHKSDEVVPIYSLRAAISD
jgi:class 3 adenylate cyclase